MPKVRQRAAARRDLVDQFVHLAENAGLATAERFLARAETSFDHLARQPLMGAPLTLHAPKLARLRMWSVTGFDGCLIFYLPRPDGLCIVRVLHGTRDWWALSGIAP